LYGGETRGTRARRTAGTVSDSDHKIKLNFLFFLCKVSCPAYPWIEVGIAATHGSGRAYVPENRLDIMR
jgi:hypothetical protein